MKWDKVTPKTTLIAALKRAAHELFQGIVTNSCASGANRLRRLSQDKRKLRQIHKTCRFCTEAEGDSLE